MSVNFRQAKSWPYQEALKVIKNTADKDEILFETGYGPSGLPHIGTFAEVFRTSLVMQAYQHIASQDPALAHKKLNMIVFSDDMDGFRKVPTNVPNQEMLQTNLGKPLTQVPDPYGTHESFAAHNNAKLREFLDRFGFQYEFRSATEEYKKGNLDKSLLAVLDNYEAITNAVKAEVGEERRQTYSPFMPICPVSGNVLENSVVGIDKDKKTVLFNDSNGDLRESIVTGGNVKLQWKVDWAARWNAYGIDYEMAGRDLKTSYDLSSKIVQLMGGKRPANMIYELFVDENEQKISKSKGNGFTFEQWMDYGTPESLQQFLTETPTSGGKKLYIGTVKQYQDKYNDGLNNFEKLKPQSQIDSPAYLIHNGNPPKGTDVSYSMLLSIVSSSGVSSAEDLLGMALLYQKSADNNVELLQAMSEKAINYYNDHILPNKEFRQPTPEEVVALTEMRDNLADISPDASESDYQNAYYAVGKKHYGQERLREWFGTIYEVLLGQKEGPRPGTLTKIVGQQKMLELFDNGLNGNQNNDDLNKPVDTPKLD